VKNLNGWLACASVLLITAGTAAGEAPNKKAAIAAEADEPDDLSRFEINTSLDVTSRRGIGAYGAVTFAPSGLLEQSGVRLKVEGVNGGYHYNTEGDPDFFQPPLLSIHGHFMGASALVGYELVTATLNLAGFVGGDYQRDSQSFNPANVPNPFGEPTEAIRNPTLGARWGVKFATDAEYHPTEQWSFLLSGNYSTANNSWWSRLRPGYAVLEDVFVGPEAIYQGNNFFQQWCAGAHVRGIKLGVLEIGLSSGFMRDSIVSNGIYGNLETSVRF
jgi:hypothetical protein